LTIKNLIHKNKDLFKKYILISIASYAFVFLSLFIFIDILIWNKTLSFIITYAIAYIVLYRVQLKHLFKVSHDNTKVLRFCGSILFFYICANVLYNIGIYLKLHYLISTLLTSAILMPFRFIVTKVFVYRSNNK